jgi:hypothetical protein
VLPDLRRVDQLRRGRDVILQQRAQPISGRVPVECLDRITDLGLVAQQALGGSFAGSRCSFGEIRPIPLDTSRMRIIAQRISTND